LTVAQKETLLVAIQTCKQKIGIKEYIEIVKLLATVLMMGNKT